MPAPNDILSLLSTMTRELTWLAVVWHVLLFAALLLAAVLWRIAGAPSHLRIVRLLLILLPLSVTTAATLYENPFNALSFGTLTIALAVAPGLRPAPAAIPGWAAWAGGALLLYGWCYPHFVAPPWYRVLFAAPLGVLPCPTLAALAGLTLVSGGLGARAVPALLSLWTAFYALFGIFRLRVYLDAGLLGATAALLVQCSAMGRRVIGAVGNRGPSAHGP